MTTKYRYIGIYVFNGPRDRPAGVVRVWTDKNGEQREETYSSSLTWEPSDVLSPMARPDYDDYVDIDESEVDRFIEQMRERYGDA